MKWILGILAVSACVHPPPPLPTGPPTLFGTAKDDVVWMMRRINTYEHTTYRENLRSAGPVYGLFACYRSGPESPGPPTCFLAKQSGDIKNLEWPGTLMWHDGKLERGKISPPAEGPVRTLLPGSPRKDDFGGF